VRRVATPTPFPDSPSARIIRRAGKRFSQGLSLTEIAAAKFNRESSGDDQQRIEFIELKVPSPFALALMVERFREQLSTEKLADRLARLLKDANAAVDREPAAPTL